jgi:opacity protein-like surface antigen
LGIGSPCFVADVEATARCHGWGAGLAFDSEWRAALRDVAVCRSGDIVKHLFRTLRVTVVAAAALALSRGAEAGLPPPPPPPTIISVPTPAPSGFNSASASSWVAGGHAGYNWQSGQVVYGFETDLQGTHLQSAMNGGLTFTPAVNPFPAGTLAQTIALIDWYGTFRARLGFATGQWLFYGTGGLAYGNVSLSSTFTGLGLATTFLSSSTQAGYVAGAGFEYLFRPNLSFGVLYEYVDLGSLSGLSMTTGPSASLSQWATTHA